MFSTGWGSRPGRNKELYLWRKERRLLGGRYGAQFRALNRYLDISDQSSPSAENFHCSDDREKIYGGGLYTCFDYNGTSYQLNQRIYRYLGNMPRPLTTITNPSSKVLLEMDAPSTKPGHGRKDFTNPFGKVPVMVLFVDGHVAGPYMYAADFESYNPDTTKPVIFDVNSTPSMGD